MKTRKGIRRFTELAAYLLFVAVFGFITTVVNHSSGADEKVQNAELVSLTIENEFETLLNRESEEVNL